MADVKVINKLFLELSQFATARTASELRCEREKLALRARVAELEELLRKCPDTVHEFSENVHETLALPVAPEATDGVPGELMDAVERATMREEGE